MARYLIIGLAFLLSLTACNSNHFGQQQAMNSSGVTTGNDLTDTPGVDTNSNVGGKVGQAMDKSDQVKMSRALDKPLGKQTTWQNLSSGMSYTVTPTAKTQVNGNHLCRRYQTSATQAGNTQTYTGVACITTDGNWHPVS